MSIPNELSTQKVVIKIVGKTLVIPTSATFCYNNAFLEIYAPNFSTKLSFQDIQEITLLDPTHATDQEQLLLQILPKSRIIGSIPKSDQQPPNQEKKVTPKKDIELQSGMI